MTPTRLPFLVLTFALSATPAGNFALTIDNIMRGPNLYGYEPSAARWSGDSQRIYFQWKQYSDPIEKDPDTYVVDRTGAAPRKLSEDEAKLAPPASGSSSIDKKRITYARDADIFVYDSSTGQTRQLTKTTDIESDPHFTQDGRGVAFTRANNLYVLSLDSGSIDQQTDIRAPGPASPNTQPASRGGRGGASTTASAEEQKGTASQEFLKSEEKDLLQIIRERAAKREEDEARKKRENPRKPFNLTATQSIAWLQLTPDAKYVIAGVRESGVGAKTMFVPNFVTESGYTDEIPGRTKVGDNQAHIRIAILNVQTGEPVWLDHGQKLAPAETKTSDASAKPAPEQERVVELSRPLWSGDGAKAVVLARAADNKDRWILALDETTGKTRVLAHDHDDDWLDGPGANTLGWMKDNRSVYFQSERTGYSHLYTVAYDGGEPHALTSGKWEVTSVTLSRDKSRFLLVTSEADPGEHNVYEMSAEGGARTRLTSEAGGHSCVPSPDDQWFADIYSYTNKPPELYVQESRAGAAARKLTSSPAPDFWE